MSPKLGRLDPFLVNVAMTFGTYVAAAFVSLVNLFVIARELGPVGRGEIVFLITVATIAGHLGALSVQEANANLAGTEPGLRRSLATNSIVLAVLCGALAAAIVAGLVWLFPAVGGDVPGLLLWIALASIPLVILRLYLHFLAQADYQFGITNLAWLLGPVTTVVVNCLLAAFDALSVESALGAWIGGQLLGLVILIVHIGRHAGFGAPHGQLAARSLRFGAKAHVGRSVAVGHNRIDQWFVGSMSGSHELGLYSVATAWAEVLSYLPGVLVLVQRPDLVRASPEDASRFAARVCRVALLLTAPLALGLAVAAPFFCVTLLGSEFEGSIGDLRVLVFAAFGVVAMELLGSALTAQRRPMWTTGAVSIAFVVTVVLASILVPRYGGLGAATTAVIASTSGGIVAVLVFSRVLGASVRDLLPTPGDVPWLWRRLRTRVAPSPGGSGS